MDRDQRLATLVSELSEETRAIRIGLDRTAEREHSEPIFTTSSFVFPDAATMADAFVNNSGLSVYARVDNPTVDGFCRRLAVLEGAESCEAAASGMGAILSTLMAHCQAGDRVLISTGVFGATLNLVKNFFIKYGLEIELVSITDLDAWEKALARPARLAYCETPSNPTIEIIDIQALSDLCRAHDCLFVVDNCFMTPVLQKPLSLGADLVIHSATKYLDGQGRVLGGAVLGRADLIEPVTSFIRSGGVTMSAFNAWIFSKGLETLDIRMKAHSEKALLLAKWLEQQPQIERVNYAGLNSHPQKQLVDLQMKAGGGVLSFTLKDGSRDDAWSFLNATCVMSLTANLGDVKTTVCHPATSTHGRLDQADRKLMGIPENMIRIAVGLESVDDLIQDCERGLSALTC
ncbi:MAG: O-succinylhomoserine sulfhydrylase [Oceanospirillales bacterium TMED33]|nr:O-succinylhomoserine sulfhydrylase [Gammaproteobacteria bacterium]RPG20716.1 MAG: O-succinylhomoserine sulfhydrylase [Oceanospirillales bacterium TMED33]CAI8293783.1 MAG: O-succinylhomoserine sulfhydrylase [Gammaproteobacteria bacterium]